MTELMRIKQAAQDAFFAAMCSGYASGVNGSPVPGMPDGWERSCHTINTNIGPLTVIDQWCTGEIGIFFGTTTILSAQKTLWYMSYRGQTASFAVPFLQKALMDAYRDDCFYGGRGKPSFVEGDTSYANAVDHNYFGSFRGNEVIRQDGTRIHVGNYFGGLLIADTD